MVTCCPQTIRPCFSSTVEVPSALDLDTRLNKGSVPRSGIGFLIFCATLFYSLYVPTKIYAQDPINSGILVKMDDGWRPRGSLNKRPRRFSPELTPAVRPTQNLSSKPFLETVNRWSSRRQRRTYQETKRKAQQAQLTAAQYVFRHRNQYNYMNLIGLSGTEIVPLYPAARPSFTDLFGFFKPLIPRYPNQSPWIIF
jgi:hypothetical protein